MQVKQTRQFKVSLDKNQWFMRVRFDPDTYTEIWGYDGDTYSATYAPYGEDKDLNRDDLPVGVRNGGPASVWPYQFPPDEGGGFMVPWLAFCSFSFSAENPDEDIPEPGAPASMYPVAHICEARARFLPGRLKLPSSVTFTTETERLRVAGQHPMLRKEIMSTREVNSRLKDYRRIYPPGLVMGEYNALTTTNLSGVVIPLTFEYKNYSLLKSPVKAGETQVGNTNTYLSVHYQGTVSRVETVAGEFPAVEFKRWMSVADHRLNDRELNIDLVNYWITNGVWQTEVTDDMRVLLEARRAEIRKKRRALLIKRVGIMLAMAAVALAPGIIYYLRRQKKVAQAVVA